MPNRFHSGEMAVQQQAGVLDPADLADNGIAEAIDPRYEAFLQGRSWAVIGAPDANGSLWASLLHGPPGFLSARDPRLLAVGARPIPSDPLAAAFERETDAGLLILDPATRRRIRINGRAKSDGRDKLLVATREVYGNCPKYIQRREPVGGPEAEAAAGDARRSTTLTPEHRRFIERADTFFIATVHADTGADCSHRGGNPGFVRAPDERRFTFPDYAGNNMFQTLGNLHTDPRAGLLFLDFETGDTLQLTGTAAVLWHSPRLQDWPGTKRLIEFELQQAVETPRAFPLRWRLVEPSPFNPRAAKALS